MNNHNFILKAEKIYRNNPEYFGFAFWKYREQLKDGQVVIRNINGIEYLYAIKENKLVFYWSEDNRMIISRNELKGLDIIYIHSKYNDAILKLSDTHHIDSGIARIYDDTFDGTTHNCDYYTSCFNFDGDDDFIGASNIINSTASQIIMTPEKIKTLMKQPVFDKKLWVIVKDILDDKPVAIGIAIYDKEIRETELEWIYVDSEHHGKGIGRMLIYELVRRSKDESKTIRVGGVADDFYIKCGFTRKTDKWLWVKKKGSNAQWWS